MALMLGRVVPNLEFKVSIPEPSRVFSHSFFLVFDLIRAIFSRFLLVFAKRSARLCLFLLKSR